MRLRQAGRGRGRRCARLPLVVMVLAVAAGGPAVADDRESGAAAPWSGFHIGGQVGVGRTNQDWEYQNPNIFNTFGATLLVSGFDFHDDQLVGGVLAGYDYQTGPLVLGVELSMVADGYEDQRPSTSFPSFDTYTSKLKWHSTATARIGYGWDRWLAFAKGGWAGGRSELNLSSPLGTAPEAYANPWANGWTAGVGLEYLVADDVSLGLAYDYVELRIRDEKVNCFRCLDGAVGGGTPIVDGDIRVQTLMLRVSYRFGDE